MEEQLDYQLQEFIRTTGKHPDVIIMHQDTARKMFLKREDFNISPSGELSFRGIPVLRSIDVNMNEFKIY